MCTSDDVYDPMAKAHAWLFTDLSLSTALSMVLYLAAAYFVGYMLLSPNARLQY